jgi:type IV pilus assembly protein PilE
MARNNGFTIIELLIVISIIGVLIGIALPSYQAHIQKGNRVAAQLTLTKAAQQFERVNARQGAYPTTISESADTYTFSVVRTDDTFTITATPTGSSVGDECATMTINQAGQTTPTTPNSCWN